MAYREAEIKRFRVACGDFIGLSDVSREEWEIPGTALVPNDIPFKEGTFAVRARGISMQPLIRDGWWCFFHPDVVGSREDRIVLVEDRRDIGGPRYTLKKYHSEKAYSEDGTWHHEEIRLLSLNRSHPPIRLDQNGDYKIRGWFVGAVPQIGRVNPLRYQQLEIN